MAWNRYYHWRRRRSRYTTDWREYHESRRQELSRTYAGIDSDVRRLFFQLDDFTLKLVFNVYERSHGDGARRYAEKTYQQWKSGSVEISGEISERLLKIVPQFLSFEQKYDLISKLWHRSLGVTNLSVTIAPDTGIQEAVKVVAESVDQVLNATLPQAVCQRLSWLSDEDAAAAEQLLKLVKRREHEAACHGLANELKQLLAVAVSCSEHRVKGVKQLRLPGACITVYVQQGQVGKGNRTMPEPQEEAKSGGAIQRRTDDSSGLPVKMDNVLDEAIGRLSPQKQQEVVHKAASEAVRLTAKQKEGQIDHELAEQRVDAATEQARRLQQTGVPFDIQAEQRSEHGHTTVNISNRPEPRRSAGCSTVLLLVCLAVVAVLAVVRWATAV